MNKQGVRQHEKNRQIIIKRLSYRVGILKEDHSGTNGQKKVKSQKANITFYQLLAKKYTCPGLQEVN